MTSYSELSDVALSAKIMELEYDLRRAKAVQNRRVGSATWECEECGYRHTDADIVISHLETVHKYPREDANLSTIRVHS